MLTVNTREEKITTLPIFYVVENWENNGDDAIKVYAVENEFKETKNPENMVIGGSPVFEDKAIGGSPVFEDNSNKVEPFPIKLKDNGEDEFAALVNPQIFGARVIDTFPLSNFYAFRENEINKVNKELESVLEKNTYEGKNNYRQETQEETNKKHEGSQEKNHDLVKSDKTEEKEKVNAKNEKNIKTTMDSSSESSETNPEENGIRCTTLGIMLLVFSITFYL